MERTFPFFRSTHSAQCFVYSVAGIWIPNFAWLGIAEFGPESSRHELCIMYILRAYNTWQLTDCNTQNGVINRWIHDFSPIYNFGSVIEGLVVVVMRYHVTVMPKVEEECSRASPPVFSQPLKIFFWSQFCCKMQHLSAAQCNPAILSQWKSRDFMIQNDQGMQFPTTVAFLLINNKLNFVINLFIFP